MVKDNRAKLADHLREKLGYREYIWQIRRGLNINHKYLGK